jgi:hypothetical protein
MFRAVCTACIWCHSVEVQSSIQDALTDSRRRLPIHSFVLEQRVQVLHILVIHSELPVIPLADVCC